MATARIMIDGAAGSRADLAVGAAVALHNDNDAGVIKWAWAIVSRPSGSAAVFANTGTVLSEIPNPSFTPDVIGTYLIRLVLNDTVLPDDPSAKNIIDVLEADQKGGAVLTANGYRKPASGETIEFSTAHGWSPPIHEVIDGLGAAEDDIAGKEASGTAAGLVSGHESAYNHAKLHSEQYTFIPVEWGEDLADAPDEAEVYENGNARHRIRSFSDSGTPGLSFTWAVPSNIKASAPVVKYRVLCIVTNATGILETDALRFSAQGFCRVDDDATTAALGAAVTSGISARVRPQHDWAVTDWSGEITLAGIAKSGVATIEVTRDNAVGSNYAQSVGVFGVEIQWVAE